ncbi:hypothetical protein FVP74_03480 [Microbacterium saccharophilum]|uniref:Uncharacterized protein n=1 Tax=Microbacterium saccharophilum TaxID=1213358 RepID=A0A5C8IAP3_9MICO|nr:IniB N-terminal domain-containing protein [Microbacterium saccharophilum]TXK15463.1 hypothetical protein FVP74_03480 [Microbacterium saccharophilum]GEP47184.1 hypothetical protein MSA03_06920 [Microbacterium saccharophilum]
MSTVISTIANALIEFILSLLRDPDTAAEFEADPEATLTNRGLDGVSYADVCSVLPLVYDHPSVVQRSDPTPASTPPPVSPRPSVEEHSNIIRELQNVINNNSYITNNATVLDQSVNQNIWAEGDVMQLFDNEAVIASGEGSTAAGNDVVYDDSTDSSTTIVAGGDATVDSTFDSTTITDSYNQATDSSATDNSTTTAAPAAEPAPAPEPLVESEPFVDESAAMVEAAPLDDPLADDEY